MRFCIAFVCLSLVIISIVNAHNLIYVDKPNGDVGIDFVVKLATQYDVRGDFGDFVLLAVDDNRLANSNNLVVAGFENSTDLAYFVVEPVELDFMTTLSDPTTIFDNYDYTPVHNKFVFSVQKEDEDIFVNSIPFNFEVVKLSETRLPAPFVGYGKSHTLNLPGAADPKIASYIAQVNSADLKAFVTHLTGEASSITTRQAQSTGAVAAQDYLRQQFSSFGFNVALQAFRTGYSSNVIATLPGVKDSKKLVLVGAHYDSRASVVSSTTERAPGANDNGSGTGALLQLAKLIHSNKLSFAYTVVLIAFSGEEQGLYGSAYAAQQYKSSGANIIAVLNADMIAYRSPSEASQCAFVSRSSTPELNTLLANITKTYVTGLTVGSTSACCTDHSSFYNQGFPATSFFERNGNIADPQYHKSGDLVNREGYDINQQYPLITRAVFASLLTIAEYQA